MRIVNFLLVSTLLLFSCSNVENSELVEVTVDIGINLRLPLSEITEEITTIDLELTDESLINPDQILKVLLLDSLVFIAEMEKMLVFDMEGKFIRSIGSKGQGPGEYIFIRSFTIDEKNKIIYINDSSKIISYDLNGKFLKQVTLSDLNNGQILGLQCFNDELLLLVEFIKEGQIEDNNKLKCYHSIIYKMNDEMQFIDSCFIRDVYFVGFFSIGRLKEYITCNNSDVYMYFPEIFSISINFHPPLQWLDPIKRVSRDTLYRFENDQLIPDFKLKFKRNGRNYNADKYIGLEEIYRSSRYIFAEYRIGTEQGSYFYFCFDTKTGISYNSKYSFEELYKGERMIRPISNNTELFYYWRTHMNENDLHNEPNPTLYVCRLKQ